MDLRQSIGSGGLLFFFQTYIGTSVQDKNLTEQLRRFVFLPRFPGYLAGSSTMPAVGLPFSEGIKLAENILAQVAQAQGAAAITIVKTCAFGSFKHMHMALKGSAAIFVSSAILYALKYAWAELVQDERQDVANNCNYSQQPVAPCSVTCGKGVQHFKEFPHEQSNRTACPILTKTEACYERTCPKHCKGQWGSWGSCSETCTKVRHYHIILPESLGGSPCPEKDGAKESTECTDGKCSIDCDVGLWNARGECTRPCGGGEQLFLRPVLQAPQGRGKACPPLEKSESCNTQECKYPKTLAKLREAISNFSSGEPVMDVVRSEADGFKSLAKSLHGNDPQGREWSTFVEEVRGLSGDYNHGKKKLYQALAKLLTLSRQAPDELEGLFREFLSRDWKLARRRFDRFLMKFSKVHEMIDEVHKSFMTMEQRAISYREKAVDQQAAFEDIAAEVRRLGVSGSESVDFSGFAVETGVDHRGGDIACGKFASISALASQCFHDSSCKAFTVLHGQPWCLKHLRFDGGPVRDHTHVFYTKLVQSGGVVQTQDKVDAFLKRWSFAAGLLMKVENTINTVVEKVDSIQHELDDMGLVLAELEGLLEIDQEVKHRVEELMNDIASAFSTIVGYLEPMMKWQFNTIHAFNAFPFVLGVLGVTAESATTAQTSCTWPHRA